MYDTSKRHTLDFVYRTVRELPREVPKVIVGNKIDLRPGNCTNYFNASVASDANAQVRLVSAKENLNVDATLDHLTRKILNIGGSSKIQCQ
jgi:50S ribosomal subunit-associated GTPase HflX